MAVRSNLHEHSDAPTGRAGAVIFAVFFVSASFLIPQPNSDSGGVSPPTPLTHEAVVHTLDSIGGYFIENKGQVNELVRYYSTGDPSVAFRDDGVMFVVRQHDGGDVPMRGEGPGYLPNFPRGQAVQENQVVKSLAYMLRFEDANSVTPVGGDRLSFNSNFFIGNNSSKWRTDVPNYASVAYKDLYDGVDLVYSSNTNGVKYEFIVKPGADPAAIEIKYEGIESLRPEGDELAVRHGLGVMFDSLPYSYAEGGVEVSCRFGLRGPASHGFDCEGRDSSKSLIIDPLIYSTYLGGGNFDIGHGIAIDGEGNTYVTGWTESTDFPTTPGAFDVSLNGTTDIFVTKLNAAGSTLLYSTYIGGDESVNESELGTEIAVDASGNACVTGFTSSTNFPITSGAFSTTLRGVYDAFVVKLNDTGSALIYSTFLGGNGSDGGADIMIDSSGYAYVTGSTNSTDFPVTTGAYDTDYGGDLRDAFVAKFNVTGDNLVYSSYLGGSSTDDGGSIDVDSLGNAYVGGDTVSTDFPTTTGAYDTTFNGVVDAFVTKLNETGSALVYSTFLGGSETEGGRAIVVDSSDNAYFTGYTNSTDFPTTSGAWDTDLNGTMDVFVTKLNETGAAVVYSTFLGGTAVDDDYSIDLYQNDKAVVAGRTNSTDFPTTIGAISMSLNGTQDAFVTMLNETGDGILYSTYLGGGGHDGSLSNQVDTVGCMYLTGRAQAGFPTTPGANDTSYVGNDDAFVTKICRTPTAPRNLAASPGKLQVNLSWEPPSDSGGYSVTNYKIYRGTTSGGESFLIQVGNVTSYVDSSVKAGTMYYYQVSAVTAIGEGQKSNEASATPYMALLLEGGTDWNNTSDAIIHSVFAADVDGDSDTEIITVGETYDISDTGDIGAEIRIWNWDGVNLTLEASDLAPEAGDRASFDGVYAEDADFDGVVDIFAVGWLNDSGNHLILFCNYTWDGANLGKACFTRYAPLGEFHSVHTTNVTWDVGKHTSVALDSSGYPHISYYGATNKVLKYAAWNGTVWNIETVDYLNDVGMYTSIALNSTDCPHISYYDETNTALKYAHKGGVIWYKETVDSVGVVGTYASIALNASGYPRISYYDATNGDLKYASWDGSRWTLQTVDGQTGDVGTYTSIALDSSGYPRISYYDVTTGDLKYARWNGTAWNKETVDSTNVVGLYTSIAIGSSGYPRISYCDATNTALKYAAWNGTAWNTETVDSANDVGMYTSIDLDSNGYPHLSYYDGTNKNLRYAAWNGTAWNMATVDSTDDVGMHTFIQLDASDNPHVSYYDETNGNLKYAKKSVGNWNNETVDSIGDSNREVVVAGQEFDGETSQASLFLLTWGYSSESEEQKTWTDGHDAAAYSVYVKDVDGDGEDEIFTAGYTRQNTTADKQGQLRMWSFDGGFVLLDEAPLWTGPTGDAEVFSVYVDDVDNDDITDVMVCGYFESAGDWGQLLVYHVVSSSLQLNGSYEWQDDGNRGMSVHAGDLDGDDVPEIVTGGWATLSGKTYGEIRVLRFNSSATPRISPLATKQWRDYTSGIFSNYTAVEVYSVFAFDVDDDDIVEVVSGGRVWDYGYPYYAQLRIWYDP